MRQAYNYWQDQPGSCSFAITPTGRTGPGKHPAFVRSVGRSAETETRARAHALSPPPPPPLDSVGRRPSPLEAVLAARNDVDDDRAAVVPHAVRVLRPEAELARPSGRYRNSRVQLVPRDRSFTEPRRRPSRATDGRDPNSVKCAATTNTRSRSQHKATVR